MKKNLLFSLGILLTSFLFAQNSVEYSIEKNFIASGYIGDFKNIQQVSNHTSGCHSGNRCIRVTYTPGELGFAGVYWQYPANNWCDKNLSGKNLSDSTYTRISFYAKSDNGGEEVKFKSGYNECGSMFTDDLIIILTTEWVEYSIDIRNKDLSDIKGAFCWIVDSKANNGVVNFYLDDIKFVND